MLIARGVNKEPNDDAARIDPGCTREADGFRRLEPRVLGFGLPVDGDVGIGVFPETEEILI